MTDTQTLEGAVALLRRVRGPFAFTTRELMDDINVFLALPSVSSAARFDPDVARSKGQSDYEQGFEHGLRARLAAEEAQSQAELNAEWWDGAGGRLGG